MKSLRFLLASCLTGHALAKDPAVMSIAIQPLDTVKAGSLEVAKKGLEEAYGWKVEILAARPLPEAAWYAPRRRYRAEKLLLNLNQETDKNYLIVLGITAKDISTTKEEHEDWGIFGLGEVAGRSCVVSTFRLGARGADEHQRNERLRKIVVHEVGHVIGLEHCPEPGCVMQDAESSIATVDAETGKFCETCKSSLAK